MNSKNHTTTSDDAQGMRFEPLGMLVAITVFVGLLGSGLSGPLPLLGGAAVFLFLVVEQDVRRGRIPNAITLPALALALAASFWIGGLSGLLSGLGGAATAFVLLFPCFVARVLGAGDVKAVMALGALWGATLTASLIGWMIFCGGALAIVLLTVRGGLVEALTRWSNMWTAFRITRRLTYFPPALGSAAASSLPFGAVIGVAVIAQNLWGTPWA